MTQIPTVDHDISDRTILITGGAGFIGSHIAEALAAENAVRVVDNLSSGTREHVPDEAELIAGDITDESLLMEAMADVDIVFHEAAVVSVERSIETPLETHTVNTEATLRLLECARKADARVVFASSAAVYGEPGYTPVDEVHGRVPTSPYGMTKLAGDQYARLYHSLYGLPTVALRYFNVYGPRQRGGPYSGVIRTFVDQALADDPITIYGDGKQTRDFVHVYDIVQANLLAATTSHVGEAINIGTGSSVTIRELAERIRDLTDSDSQIVHTDPREGDIRDSCADLTKARAQLGYEPKVPLAPGLKTVSGIKSEIDPSHRF